MNKAALSTPEVRMEIIDDVVHFTYLPGVVINITKTKEIVKLRLEYTKKMPYPILIMGEGLRSFDKESRNYSAIQGIEGILAAAIQTDSVYTHFFGNMFLKITTTTIPTKLFNDKMQALLWLEQFKSATSIINKTDLAPSLS